MAIGVQPRPGITFGVPAESYGFENKRTGWK